MDFIKHLQSLTNDCHTKNLIKFYQCGICFKYLNGACNDINCKYKHPMKCKSYTFNNQFRCKYGISCHYAHINYKYQPNGTNITKNRTKQYVKVETNNKNNNSKTVVKINNNKKIINGNNNNNSIKTTSINDSIKN